jgi:hypothetical protein
MNKAIAIIGSVLLALGSLTANAASVSLVPSVSTVGAGGTFSLDLQLSAADRLVSGYVGEFSGLVAIRFNSQFVDFTSFAFSAPATELVGVSVTPDGTDDIVMLGFENALDTGVIGTYSFTVNDLPDPIPPIGTIFTFDVYDADDFFDSFANESPSNQTFVPEFNGTSVTVVPLPMPLVLLLSAFATLLPAVRRRAR